MNKMDRVVNGKMVSDKRKWYVFETYDGRLAGTKAVTKEDAMKHVKQNIKLKRAA